jgi:hypothetical protein
VVVAAGRVAGTWAVDGGTLGIELFAEAGPVDAAGLENEVGFLEKVLGTALTPAVSTV